MKSNKVFDYLGVACISLILILVVVQVVMRYVFNFPLVWSEELAVYSMVWLTFIGSALATKDKEHITVTIVTEFLPKKIRRVVMQMSRVITCIFLLIIIFYGSQLSFENFNVTSVANRIPMGYVYGIIPLGALAMLYYNLKIMQEGE